MWEGFEGCQELFIFYVQKYLDTLAQTSATVNPKTVQAAVHDRQDPQLDENFQLSCLGSSF